MTTKEKLAEMLEIHDGEYLSGTAISEELGISRAAISKAMKQLEESGYRIKAVQNKGYMLRDTSDAVSKYRIEQYLGEYNDIYSIEVYDTISSTNTVLKERATELPSWYAIIAGSQNKGRGRRTRSFFSPANSGVYLSVLLKLPLTASESTHITTAAAVAACRAIESCTDAEPVIKWVNDVYVDGLKICGILTEASISIESGVLDWAVMGIGFNVYEPEEGFPEELKGIAGAITAERKKNLRSQLAAAFLKNFYEVCQDLLNKKLVEEYKKRSFILGLPINVIRGDSKEAAVAIDIDDDCGLIVRYEDGRVATLSSGEVSIRPIR